MASYLGKLDKQATRLYHNMFHSVEENWYCSYHVDRTNKQLSVSLATTVPLVTAPVPALQRLASQGSAALHTGCRLAAQSGTPAHTFFRMFRVPYGSRSTDLSM
jgi:hypothetical protein